MQISDNFFPGIKTILSFFPHVWNMDTTTRAIAAIASGKIEGKGRRTAKTSFSLISQEVKSMLVIAYVQI